MKIQKTCNLLQNFKRGHNRYCQVCDTTYRGVWLEQVGVVFIPSSYQQWNAKWTHSTGGKKQTKQPEYILPCEYEHDVSISSVCISVSLCIPTQTVCTLALQRPLSGQAGLWGLAPGKPGSTVVPISGLAAPKPCMNDNSLIIWACEVRQTLRTQEGYAPH